ncbi:cob(I)alamin adenosyltransferase [Devosia enhydra]|uniref:Corrinoid adenosyltransferase n=1 Tax=Devosia enhydra TaxID=665118 RepID=A0A1K2I070_9HYPH|nr:cob(I)yrinic acid a,c-diamide adenosyltransferase [Devosia enhydra]SFZ85728.1 cob(I)alamin adenosyltransferase [Devosia enhydra]
MVKLNKIYTKTGDNGTTGLVRGPRRMKYDLRVEVFGTIDETNSAIGLARLQTQGMPRLDSVLARIQNDLFDLGSDFATPGQDPDGVAPSLRITADQAAWIEGQIDAFNEQLAPLTSFVLPGGTPLAAALHLARTISRRAERHAFALAGKEPEVNAHALVYLNRLSDLLFVMARAANGNGSKDVLWQPGQFTGEQKRLNS